MSGRTVNVTRNASRPSTHSPTVFHANWVIQISAQVMGGDYKRRLRAKRERSTRMTSRRRLGGGSLEEGLGGSCECVDAYAAGPDGPVLRPVPTGPSLSEAPPGTGPTLKSLGSYVVVVVVVDVVHLQLFELASERVSTPAEELGRFLTMTLRALQSSANEHALEFRQGLVEQWLLARHGVTVGPARQRPRPIRIDRARWRCRDQLVRQVL